jgi:ubiquinone/menaquinone biosynthesis C-methylase UbiE
MIAAPQASPVSDHVPPVIIGNVYDKYGSKNPLARWLMNGFLSGVTELARSTRPRTVLEVGCGEGRLAHHLLSHGIEPERFVACDLSLAHVAHALDPRIEFLEASIYDLPFASRSFDLVVCCEVLEHLEEPRRGLREVARVARNHLLVSTPREPLWRVMNVMRGKYLRDFGNTPGHVQHFGTFELTKLVEREARVLARKTPLPWTVLLATPPAP